MKPDEIKKALECCSEQEGCYNCPCYSECGDLSVVTTEALNYIYQLESKIKALRMDNNQLQSDIVNANGNYEEIKKDCEMLKQALAQKIVFEIKTEAIKEFAERLKNEIISDTAYGCDTNQHSGYYDYSIKVGDIPEYIDTLVKEMVGDNNG